MPSPELVDVYAKIVLEKGSGVLVDDGKDRV